MTLSWCLPVCFTSFLLSLASQSGGCLMLACSIQSSSAENFIDICEEDGTQHSTGADVTIENKDPEHNFTCLLYQTNVLTCSWSIQTFEKDMGISAAISVCNYEELVDSKTQKSVEKTGSLSWKINSENLDHVILRFNTSLQDKWTTYSHSFEKGEIIVLPSPNVSALIKDGLLQISWEIPGMEFPEHCYDFQLDMGDQNPKNLTGKLFYTEPNADPSLTYKLRMRTKMSLMCAKESPWSEWSPIFTLEKTNKLNLRVIVSIILGIPMILLPLLLLLRRRRVSKLLFPPIPRPPQKYQYFLEKNDSPSFSCPAPPAKQEEEITEVEDVEQSFHSKK